MSSVCSYESRNSRQSSRSNIDKKLQVPCKQPGYGERQKAEKEEDKIQQLQKIQENQEKFKALMNENNKRRKEQEKKLKEEEDKKKLLEEQQLMKRKSDKQEAYLKYLRANSNNLLNNFKQESTQKKAMNCNKENKQYNAQQFPKTAVGGSRADQASQQQQTTSNYSKPQQQFKTHYNSAQRLEQTKGNGKADDQKQHPKHKIKQWGKLEEEKKPQLQEDIADQKQEQQFCQVKQQQKKQSNQDDDDQFPGFNNNIDMLTALNLDINNGKQDFQKIQQIYQKADKEVEQNDFRVNFENEWHDSDQEGDIRQSKLLESLDLDTQMWMGKKPLSKKPNKLESEKQKQTKQQEEKKQTNQISEEEDYLKDAFQEEFELLDKISRQKDKQSKLVDPQISAINVVQTAHFKHSNQVVDKIINDQKINNEGSLPYSDKSIEEEKLMKKAITTNVKTNVNQSQQEINKLKEQGQLEQNKKKEQGQIQQSNQDMFKKKNNVKKTAEELAQEYEEEYEREFAKKFEEIGLKVEAGEDQIDFKKGQNKQVQHQAHKLSPPYQDNPKKNFKQKDNDLSGGRGDEDDGADDDGQQGIEDLIGYNEEEAEQKNNKVEVGRPEPNYITFKEGRVHMSEQGGKSKQGITVKDQYKFSEQEEVTTQKDVNNTVQPQQFSKAKQGNQQFKQQQLSDEEEVTAFKDQPTSSKDSKQQQKQVKSNTYASENDKAKPEVQIVTNIQYRQNNTIHQIGQEAPINSNNCNFKKKGGEESTTQSESNGPQKVSKFKKKLQSKIVQDKSLNIKRDHSPNTACTRDEDINVEEFLRDDLININKEEKELQNELLKLHIDNADKLKEVECKNNIKIDYISSKQLPSYKQAQGSNPTSAPQPKSVNTNQHQANNEEDLEQSLIRLDQLLANQRNKCISQPNSSQPTANQQGQQQSYGQMKSGNVVNSTQQQPQVNIQSPPPMQQGGVQGPSMPFGGIQGQPMSLAGLQCQQMPLGAGQQMPLSAGQPSLIPGNQLQLQQQQQQIMMMFNQLQQQFGGQNMIMPPQMYMHFQMMQQQFATMMQNNTNANNVPPMQSQQVQPTPAQDQYMHQPNNQQMAKQQQMSNKPSAIQQNEDGIDQSQNSQNASLMSLNNKISGGNVSNSNQVYGPSHQQQLYQNIPDFDVRSTTSSQAEQQRPFNVRKLGQQTISRAQQEQFGIEDVQSDISNITRATKYAPPINEEPSEEEQSNPEQSQRSSQAAQQQQKSRLVSKKNSISGGAKDSYRKKEKSPFKQNDQIEQNSYYSQIQQTKGSYQQNQTMNSQAVEDIDQQQQQQDEQDQGGQIKIMANGRLKALLLDE